MVAITLRVMIRQRKRRSYSSGNPQSQEAYRFRTGTASWQRDVPRFGCRKTQIGLTRPGVAVEWERERKPRPTDGGLPRHSRWPVRQPALGRRPEGVLGAPQIPVDLAGFVAEHERFLSPFGRAETPAQAGEFVGGESLATEVQVRAAR